METPVPLRCDSWFDFRHAGSFPRRHLYVGPAIRIPAAIFNLEGNAFAPNETVEHRKFSTDPSWAFTKTRGQIEQPIVIVEKAIQGRIDLAERNVKRATCFATGAIKLTPVSPPKKDRLDIVERSLPKSDRFHIGQDRKSTRL